MEPWENAPIVKAAPARAAWENAPIVQANGPRVAQGILDDLQAGWQGSATGLLVRGRLPDVVLDPHHAAWYDKLVSSAAQMGSELPEMVGGAALGTALGTALGGPLGGIVGGGAGAFAVPTAIRESLTQYYMSRDGINSADWLSRTGIVIGRTAKDALVGGLSAATGGAAMGAGRALATGHTLAQGVRAFAAGTAFAGPMTAGASRLVAGGALAAEGTVMTVAPAFLEGRLPERDDFINGAILLVGMHGAQAGARRLMAIYAKTGIRPEQVVADAKVDPTIVEDLARPTGELEATAKAMNELATLKEPGGVDEVPRAYRELADRQAIEDAVPGVPEEAPHIPSVPGLAEEVARELFGPGVPLSGEPGPTRINLDTISLFERPTQLPGEPKPTQLNTERVRTDSQLAGALARAADIALEPMIDAQRRGVVTWLETEAAAAKWLADTLGMENPFVSREPGTPAGAAELVARKWWLEGVAKKMKAEAGALARLGKQAKPDDFVAFMRTIDEANWVQAQFLGARAETARALQALRDARSVEDYVGKIQEMMRATGGDPAAVAKMVAAMESPEQVIKFARDAAKASTWDKVIEAYKAGLVSGPQTQMANLMGNLSFAAMRPLVDATAAAFGMATGAPERVRFSEPAAAIWNTIRSTQDIVNAWNQAVHVFGADISGSGKAEHRHAIEGKTGYYVRTPFRLLSGADAFFRWLNERYEAYSIGAREAAKEGLNPATREFHERVRQIADNPTEAMIDQIEASGDRYTFNTPLGEHGRAIANLVRSWRLEWAIPFIATPGNVFKEMARLSPAAPIVGEWRADFAAGGARRQKALAEVAVGTSLMSLTFAQALAGNISGAGGPDPDKRRVQMAAGWQPYSIKIGKTWYSYQRLQPVGTLLGMAADLSEVWHHLTPEESDKTAKMLAVAFGNAVTNQTFLQGLTNVVDAISDPDRDGTKFVRNTVASLVPAVISQTAQIADPYQREVHSIRQAVENRIPGLREKLMPQRDPFGAPVPSQERIAGIAPIGVKSESEDPVRLEAARLDLRIVKAPKSVNLPSAGQREIGKVELTDEQRDVFGTVAGQKAYEILYPMVTNPEWAGLDRITKERAFEMAIERGRHLATVTVLSPEQRQAEVIRILHAINKKMTAQ